MRTAYQEVCKQLPAHWHHGSTDIMVLQHCSFSTQVKCIPPWSLNLPEVFLGCFGQQNCTIPLATLSPKLFYHKRKLLQTEIHIWTISIMSNSIGVTTTLPATQTRQICIHNYIHLVQLLTNIPELFQPMVFQQLLHNHFKYQTC